MAKSLPRVHGVPNSRHRDRCSVKWAMINRFMAAWLPRLPIAALLVLLIATTVVFLLGRNGHLASCTQPPQAAVIPTRAPPAAPSAAPATLAPPAPQDTDAADQTDVSANTDDSDDTAEKAETWPKEYLRIALGKTAAQATLGEQFAAVLRGHRGVTDESQLRVCGEHRLSNRRAFVAICTVGKDCFACGGGVEFYDLHRIGNEVHVDFKKHGDKIRAFGNPPEISAIVIGPHVPGFLARGGFCHSGSCADIVEVFSLLEMPDYREDPSLDEDFGEKNLTAYTQDDRRNYHGIYKSAEINLETSNTGEECRTRRCFELELRVALQTSHHSRYKDLRVNLSGKAAVIDGDELVPVHRQWVLPFEHGSYLVPDPLRRHKDEE